MGPQRSSCGRRPVSVAHLRLRSRASMGPQRSSCGRRSRTIISILIIHCFNGAAAFKLRKTRPAHLPADPQVRFNGAAAFKLRKTPLSAAIWMAGITASMGPQRSSCGRHSLPPHLLHLLHSFNGAAAFKLRKTRGFITSSHCHGRLQWGRSVQAAEDVRGLNRCHFHQKCFNGAAAFKLRKTSGSAA